jgi:hypothetical protein
VFLAWRSKNDSTAAKDIGAENTAGPVAPILETDDVPVSP